MAAAMAPPQPQADADRQREFDDKVRFFNGFLHGNRDEWEKKINTVLSNGKHRIPLEMNELDRAEPGLGRRVLEEPVKYLVPWEEAMLNFLRDINEKA